MKKLSIACGLLIASGTLFPGTVFGQQYQISTFAGNGVPGWSGDLGPATSAQFNTPIRVAVDGKGGVLIVDYGNSSVRKVFPDGTINSITGNGTAGFSGDGGSAVGAQLSSPHEIALDAAGNLYIADTANARVRVVRTDGNIYTFAGTGTRGYTGDNGPAVNANLTLPSGVAVDKQGNVYIADEGTATVRKVTPGGIITPFAGVGFRSLGTYSGEGGPANQALLGIPYSVATDAAGNVYISDIGLGRLFRVGSDGKIRTIATNFQVQSLTVDAAGNIYFANYQNHTVQKLLPNGTILWIGGDGILGYTGDNGPGTFAQMWQPYGVAVDAAGNVFVAEAGNAVVRKLTPVPNSIGAIGNAATNQPFVAPVVTGQGDATVPLSPGEIVTIFGTGLGPATPAINPPDANGSYTKQLAGVTVTFDGIPAAILNASSTLITAIVPYGIGDGRTETLVLVNYQGKVPYSLAPVASTAPGLFTADNSGFGQALAVNPDGTRNSAANPVAVGGNLTLYATGEGLTSPAGVDGKGTPKNAPIPTPTQTVTAIVNGVSAPVNFAGGVPGLVAGLMQVNIQIPSGTLVGTANVQLNVGGVFSPTVTIAVSN